MNEASYISTGDDAVDYRPGSPLLDGLRKLNNLLFESELSKEDIKTNKTRGELLASGFSRFQLDRRETRHIIAYLNNEGHVRAGIRGHIYGIGGVLLIATDSRLIYLHDTPLYCNLEEYAYRAIIGLSINRSDRLSSVTVFTKFKTYQLDFVNPRQAERFLSFLESRIYKPPLQIESKQHREMPMG